MLSANKMPDQEDYAKPMSEMNMLIYFSGPPEWYPDGVTGATSVVGSGLNALKRHTPRVNKIAAAAYAASSLLAPPDYPWTGVNGRDEFIKSTMNGIFAGVLVASEVHGRRFPFDAAFEHGLTVDTDDDNGRIAYDQSVAQGLIGHADAGLVLIGSRNRRMLDRWAPELINGHNLANVRSVKIGFGMSVMAAYNAHEKIVQARLRANDGK
jgi:hypothetical protein